MDTWYCVLLLCACAAVSAVTSHDHDHVVDCNQLDDVAAARCVIELSSWGSLASSSRDSAILGYPFASVKSFAANEEGQPYLYLTPLDLLVRDIIERDNRTTLVVSLAQSDYCATRDYDPMNPFCARTMLTGTLRQVERSSGEYDSAWKTLVDKHPEFSTYPQDHGWFLAKLNVEHIFLINGHGAAKRVSVPDYRAYRSRTAPASASASAFAPTSSGRDHSPRLAYLLHSPPLSN